MTHSDVDRLQSTNTNGAFGEVGVGVNQDLELAEHADQQITEISVEGFLHLVHVLHPRGISALKRQGDASCVEVVQTRLNTKACLSDLDQLRHGGIGQDVDSALVHHGDCALNSLASALLLRHMV